MVKIMNKIIYSIFLATTSLMIADLHGQNNGNCFLDDFELKTAEIPHAENAEKPVDPASVIVAINGTVIGEISKYVFGNAIAAWAGAHDNPVLVEGIKILAPTLIRFPGGSWSNGYFFNGVPADVPNFIYDGTTYNATTQTANQLEFVGHDGTEGWVTSTDQYYTLRRNTNVTEGLITINYGYARYGTSNDPVAQAAHLAADWVRYDKGRTKFWEIGNENGGPWEYGWMIDTRINKDGQPQIISGELYGKHFKVFADSMRKAAEEIGTKIYIGGQIIHVDARTSWNFPDRTWNQGFFKEVGDAADFYVIHNYFSTSNNVQEILNWAATEPERNMDFIRQDINNKKAYSKPVALTEYNLGSGSDTRAVSYINGMQAVVLIGELIKNNYGLGARWLLISGETTMFYGGSDANFSNHPHADFYYLTFLQKFYGDHAISAVSSDPNILCYASNYFSGEAGVIIVNTGTSERVVRIDIKTVEDGQNYYIYSFTGGRDHGDFSPYVYINGYGPDENHWGPYEELSDIPAHKYPIEDEIKFTSPARSIQMILIEGSIISETGFKIINLSQNYPNPFNSRTRIDYKLLAKAFVVLKVYDVLGREVETLVSENKGIGDHFVEFDGADLSSGVYFCRVEAGASHDTKKLLLLK